MSENPDVRQVCISYLFYIPVQQNYVQQANSNPLYVKSVRFHFQLAVFRPQCMELAFVPNVVVLHLGLTLGVCFVFMLY